MTRRFGPGVQADAGAAIDFENIRVSKRIRENFPQTYNKGDWRRP
jgi:hypothetical protein